MIPLEVPRQPNLVKVIFWLFCASLVALAAVIPAQTKNALATPPGIEGIAGITKGYCASDLNGPIVYFSNIFDANLKARTQISTQPLAFAFRNYLVEEFDFKANSHYPARCSVFETLSQAEANKRQLVSQAQQARKQVVEVIWNPGPLAEVPQGDGASVGPSGETPTHTVCAVGHDRTMYFSAVFDTAGPYPKPAWSDGFNEFLRNKYGFEAQVDASCTTMSTVREAEQLLKDRVGGVRARNNKAVETGWKFGSSSTASARPGPRPRPTPKDDDDPEPVAPLRPPAKAAPADIRQFATTEVPAALAYCQNDRMISGAFDCYCIQRAVYNYRMEHASEPGPPEPLADLFAKDKLNCSNCIAQFVTMWATSRAQSQSLTRPVAECVAKRFETALRAKPYPRHVKELFNGAIAACK